MPTLGGGGLGQMSQLKWGAAASRVARVISGASDPDSLAAAKDCLREAMQDWDTRREWRYLQTVADDITVTAGTDEYGLPTNFKKPYTAFLSSSQVPLQFRERFEWDKHFAGDTARGLPQIYTLFNHASTGNVKLHPIPAADDNLVVLYVRNATYSDDDDAFLDLPSRWEGYILAGARYRLVGSKEGNAKAEFWKDEYEKGYSRALGDDMRAPDLFLQFRPGAALQLNPYWNLNATWPYLVE